MALSTSVRKWTRSRALRGLEMYAIQKLNELEVIPSVLETVNFL
ncbi:MAG: hypothetical protein ACRCYY_08750 [Trueperaceae bacterium]